MTFTNGQREQIETSGTVPMNIDGISCVVLRADVYERWKDLLSNGRDHDELRSILARSAENSDWLDASMDLYDKYDEHR